MLFSCNKSSEAGFHIEQRQSFEVTFFIGTWAAAS